MCTDDEDIEVVRKLEDGRQLVRHRCGFEWEHGEPPEPLKRSLPLAALKTRFPTADDVQPEWRERADRLKAESLRSKPSADPAVPPYWEKYQQVFSRDGLWHCDPKDLKDFANTETGANPGNMSVFNTAWNAQGTDAAADSVRRTIDYLLYGPEEIPLEDRLQELLYGTKPYSLPGFKEALLTKVLCIVYPDRFLSILKYTTEAGGKREIARSVYGLELPAPESVNWTLGRLILWSNDLLRELVGEGFINQQHAAQFLWDSKDGGTAVASEGGEIAVRGTNLDDGPHRLQ